MTAFHIKTAPMGGGNRELTHKLKKIAQRSHRRFVTVRVQTRYDEPDFDADVDHKSAQPSLNR